VLDFNRQPHSHEDHNYFPNDSCDVLAQLPLRAAFQLAPLSPSYSKPLVKHACSFPSRFEPPMPAELGKDSE
jgi:hypothetical protein